MKHATPRDSPPAAGPAAGRTSQVERQWQARFRGLSAGAAMIAGAIGLVKLVFGWLLGLGWARSTIPGAGAMQPATAAVVVLCSLAYWLLRAPAPRRAVAAVGYAFAVSALAIEIAVLVQVIATGSVSLSSFGITQARELEQDGRTRIVTDAVAVGCCALALLLRSTRVRGWRPTGVFALAAGMTGLFALLAHAPIPARNRSGPGPLTGMPLATALSVAALGLALLSARPDRGAMRMLSSDTRGGRLTRWLIGAEVVIGGMTLKSVHTLTAQQNEVVWAAIALLGGGIVWTFARALDSSDERARRIEAEAQVVLDTMNDAFVSIDQRGVINLWNPGAAKLFGWSAEEALGRRFPGLIVPVRNRARVLHELARMAAGESSRGLGRYETALLRRDGREVPVDLQAWRVDSGTVTYNAVLRDISQRRQLEAALIAARDRALDETKAKTQFLAHMSHEIRTPMNGVIGLTDLLLDTPLTETQRHYVEGIQTAGGALLAVINDILDYSKLDAGKVVIELTPFDPARLVDGVAEIFAKPAADKGVELIGYCDPSLTSNLSGDPTRLRQILLNFTSNALKFTSRGEVVVRFEPASTGPGPDGTVQARLSVSDTGPGIAEADRERLFAPFVQADSSTTRRFGGSGLGLAICSRLVEAMDGRIGVDSQVGVGSTFWCVVPLRATDSRVAPGPTARDLDHLRILIVDDNATNRLVLTGQLGAWGMDPAAVDGAAAALAALRSAAARGSAFDIALLDMNMPGFNGLDLARQITADPAINSTHRVLLTSGSVPDPAAAQSAGIAAMLTKPVGRAQLYDCLATVLTGGGAAVTTAFTEPERARGPAAAAQPSADRPMRGLVLLVEDNEINLAVGTGFLDTLGYAWESARDGLEALERITGGRYDAVLMDCQMPVMDGYDAANAVREREGVTLHTPIIALTASALVQDRERCIAAGMDDYLAKPINRAALRQTLELWIPEGADYGMRTAGPAGTIAARLADLGGSSAVAGLAGDLGAVFTSQGTATLRELAEAIGRSDVAAVRSGTHRFKGAAGNIGARTLAALCAELEAMDWSDRPQSAADVLHRVELEFALARDALAGLADGTLLKASGPPKRTSNADVGPGPFNDRG